MLKEQIFDIDNIIISFINDGGLAKIKVNKYINEPGVVADHLLNPNQRALESARIVNEISIPLPQFRKLMDILAKTKFMFSSDNK